MLKHLRKTLSALLVLLLLLSCCQTVYADDNTKNDDAANNKSVWKNPETGYVTIIDDNADLLSAQEEAKLLERMKEISQYGHVAFVSISENPYHDSKDYIEYYYYRSFYNESGTVLLIDMDERYIRIYSDGKIEKTITASYADTITDNVYTYASKKDYFTCADKAFDQILSLLKGQWIAQPMKYISNALLATILALLINYFLVMFLSMSRKPSDTQLINAIHSRINVTNTSVSHTRQTKTYSPISSGSSGGSSSRSGSSRSSSSSRSRGGGSGGGHRF